MEQLQGALCSSWLSELELSSEGSRASDLGQGALQVGSGCG